MIYLLAGTTHTGKTNLAHKLMLKYGYPYLSIDHVSHKTDYCDSRKDIYRRHQLRAAKGIAARR